MYDNSSRFLQLTASRLRLVLFAAGLFNYGCPAPLPEHTIASDEAASACPVLQRTDALLCQDVASAEQDGRADQNRQCHHSSSFFESSFVLLICFQN
jgi:hypothetical protein